MGGGISRGAVPLGSLEGICVYWGLGEFWAGWDGIWTNDYRR